MVKVKDKFIVMFYQRVLTIKRCAYKEHICINICITCAHLLIGSNLNITLSSHVAQLHPLPK